MAAGWAVTDGTVTKIDAANKAKRIAAGHKERFINFSSPL